MNTADIIALVIIMWAVIGFLLGMMDDISNGYRVVAWMLIWPFVLVGCLVVLAYRAVIGVTVAVRDLVKELIS